MAGQRVVRALLLVPLLAAGCNSRRAAYQGGGTSATPAPAYCQVTPPTRWFTTSDGGKAPELGSETFFLRDAGQPWKPGVEHKTVWWYPKADQSRELRVTGQRIAANGEKQESVEILRVEIKSGDDPGRATGPTIPEVGCWALHAEIGSERLDWTIYAPAP